MYVVLILASAVPVVLLPTSYYGSVGVIVGLLGILVEYFFAETMLRGRMTMAYKQQAALKDPLTYTWDIEHLTVSSPMAHAKRPWRNYIRFIEAESVFLLYHNEFLFEVVPKAWFTDGSQIEDFKRCATLVGA